MGIMIYQGDGLDKATSFLKDSKGLVSSIVCSVSILQGKRKIRNSM
jgi:hypothetical protein